MLDGDEKMIPKKLTMLAVGDLIFDTPEPESLSALVEPVLRSAEVVVGQLEVVFTARGERQYTEVPAPPCDPKNLETLAAAHFNVVTLAGNHIWDSGTPGIEDTIAGLRGYGIAFTGAGMNIAEARRPAVIERNGTRIGFLAYNCIGPKDSWATPDKPGCAYVNVLTHYEQDHATPASPPNVYTFAEPSSLQAMVDDIKELRQLCGVLVVALHKGFPHTPVKVAMYEQQLSYAAVDAGADVILGHHAHILKGIELYRGKPIFHGLGNFITVTRALTEAPSWDLEQWIKRRKELFGFEPDPEYPTYPFHPEAKQTIIAKCLIDGESVYRVSYLPCLINKQGQPEILRNDERGRQVFEYIERITREAGLNARFEWEGDEVVISTEQA